MKEFNYLKVDGLRESTLEAVYDGSGIEDLRFNLSLIVETEAPITLNLIKARLREVFNVKKISQKALDIILEECKSLGFIITDNLYDIAFWPASGVFDIDYIRIGLERQIYDICYQELINLVLSLNLSGEELYRAVLNYFGYEVLTKKALDYLVFVEGKI